MENQEIIRLQNIAVSFDGEKVLDDFSLSIRNGEFVTLLGPSGCGKTTTLRIIGGFVSPDEGDVFFDGELCEERIWRRRFVPGHPHRERFHPSYGR